jgi:hypothetical protein
VIVGQLLYGWAARGHEGLNKQQIIAASGLLGDRSQAVTRAVLRYCYRPPEDNFGWARRGDLDIIFRRTLTGVDGAGRPGAFLVHALVSEAGTLAPGVLGELWEGGIWQRQPAEPPPEGLDAIGSLADLQLRPLPGLEAERLERALAGYLARLCAERRFEIRGNAPEAVALAAGIAEALPGELGLPAFSTREEGERRELYDLLGGGGEDSEAHAAEQEIDELWLAAARLLLEAGAGDMAAHGIVAATLEETKGTAEFAERLHRWLELERASSQGVLAAPAALADAAADARFALRLVESEAVGPVCEAALEGNRDALQAISWTAGTAAQERVATLLGEKMEALSTRVVVERIERLAAITGPMGRAVAERALDGWLRGGGLPSFVPSDALSLARIIAGDGGRPNPAVRKLLSVPELAETFAASRGLPLSWRAAAAAANPREVSPRVIGEAVSRYPEFARRLLSEGGGEAEAVISAALTKLDVSGAMHALVHLEPASKPSSLRAWRLQTLARLPAADRLLRLQELAEEDPRTAEYAEALLDAFIDRLLEVRDLSSPLLGAPRLPKRAKSERLRTWHRLNRELRRVGFGDGGAAEAAARFALSLDSPRETDVALELIVDEIAKYAPDESRWGAAIDEAIRGSRQTWAGFAPRLIRAGLRGADSFSREAAAWTVCWVAFGLEKGALSARLLEHERADELSRALTTLPQVQRIRTCAEQSREKAVRKWLLEMARNAEREHPKEGRLVRLRQKMGR